jgi:signal peptidase II
MPLGTYGAAPGTITLIENFFYLVHVGNTGAAWSMLSGKSTLLATLAGITLLGIYFWRRALGLRERWVQLSFGLLCGGIVGNLIDRIAYGHVVDFLDFHFGNYVYPTFNVADSGICVGVGIYLIYSLRNPPEKNVPGPPDQTPPH